MCPVEESRLARSKDLIHGMVPSPGFGRGTSTPISRARFIAASAAIRSPTRAAHRATREVVHAVARGSSGVRESASCANKPGGSGIAAPGSRVGLVGQAGGEPMVSVAWDSLDAAGEIARKIGADRYDYGLAFGPSNVAQHAVAVAVEMGDGAEAIRRERETKLGVRVPPIRRSHYIDVARAHLMEGDRAGALEALQRARRIAPQHVRHHPMVRETIYAIADGGRGSDDLTSFVSWLGLTAV